MEENITPIAESILQEIQESNQKTVSAAPEEKQTIYLLFKAGENHYAIDSSNVKEILRNNEVFPIPFLPPYARGVLNCYGKPMVVIDLSLYYGYQQSESNLFLVANDDNDIAFQISSLIEFHATANLMQTSADIKTYKGAVEYMNMVIPVLDYQELIALIRSDFESE